jgi:hypothetical protein
VIAYRREQEQKRAAQIKAAQKRAAQRKAAQKRAPQSSSPSSSSSSYNYNQPPALKCRWERYTTTVGGYLQQGSREVCN